MHLMIVIGGDVKVEICVCQCSWLAVGIIVNCDRSLGEWCGPVD